MTRKILALLFFFAFAIAAQPVRAQAPNPNALRIIGWNMQSDWDEKRRESDPNLLSRQMGAKDGVHLWGLCEVLDRSALEKFRRGAQATEAGKFEAILSRSGGRDKQAIIYDKTRFELVGRYFELRNIALSGSLRAPLVARLRDKKTGQQFLFMVNHLKRGESQNRQRREQAKRLNEWVRTQSAPVVAVGDYNFDYHVTRGDKGVPNRCRGFDEMTRGGKFTWLRPEKLLKTNSDDNYNTVLDFVFVANMPKGWSGKSRILKREGR